MPQRVQQIFQDTGLAIPATYVVPPGMDLELASVVARWNGAGAGGSFKPALSIYSQNGKLMARVAPGTDLSVGDTAVVTYAPF